MAALLPDYEYDIFISYRHNDSEWMAEFIIRLQNELKTIIKRPLSIYYDRDINDGLGETHLVQGSLDHRVLNSMILMPLISMTYCDTERYSWQKEFLPFLQHAKTDRLSLNLPLAGGNEGSRILPLRLHNLDVEDTQLLEKTLGGQLRSIDFVYQDLGVNRPLRVKDDDRATAVARTLYSDQVNKVANAIKALVAAAATKAQQSAPPGPVVFLAWTAKNLKARREELALVCTKAGLRVVPTTDCPSDEEEFRRKTQESLAAADCSLHLLGNAFGKRFEEEAATSFPLYAYSEARRQAAERPGFQQFVWYSPDAAAVVDKDQQDFVGQIRNELTAQCTFSSAPDAPQLVQELRSALVQATPPPVSAEKDTDVCFVFNALDRDEADAITDRLSEQYSLNVLAINPNSEDKYKETMALAIPKSKLAVVYYKNSADWALPFVKQVWQLLGGAASPTPILYVGEDDPAQSCLQSFKAPKVISRIKTHQGVSEEVQRVFQTLNTPA